MDLPKHLTPNVENSVDSTTIEAQLNPYLLHNSSASTAVLVTQSLVGASNYLSWSKAMHLALSGKNKLSFINGTIKKPEGALLGAWQCNNDIITSWIINSVSKNIATRYSKKCISKGCLGSAERTLPPNQRAFHLSVAKTISHNNPRYFID